MQYPFKELGRAFHEYAVSSAIKSVRIPDLKNVKPNSELFRIMRWKVPFRFIKVLRLNDTHLNMDESIQKMLIYSTQKDVNTGTKKMINALKTQIMILERELSHSTRKTEIQTDISNKKLLLNSMIQKDLDDVAEKVNIGTVARKVYKILTNNTNGSDLLYNEISMHGRSTEETNANVDFILSNAARDKKYSNKYNNKKQSNGNWKEELRSSNLTDVKKYVPPSKKLDSSVAPTKCNNSKVETDAIPNKNVYVPPKRDNSKVEKDAIPNKNVYVPPKRDSSKIETDAMPNKNVYVPPNKRDSTSNDNQSIDKNKSKVIARNEKFININDIVNFDNEFPIIEHTGATQSKCKTLELDDTDKLYTEIAENGISSANDDNQKPTESSYTNVVGTMGRYKLIVNASLDNTTSESSSDDADDSNSTEEQDVVCNVNTSSQNTVEEEINELTNTNKLLSRTWKFSCPSPYFDENAKLTPTQSTDSEKMTQCSRSNSTTSFSSNNNNFEYDDMSWDNFSEMSYSDNCCDNNENNTQHNVNCANSIGDLNEYFESYIDDSFSDCE